MLKFFRKIRQNLIDKGDAKRYLLYAIGEIFLVVIGILIALQINNWNENRLERKEEQNALLNLKDDFEYNQRSLEVAIERLKGMIDGSIKILEQTGEKYNTEANFNLDSLLILATATPRYFPQNGFLNDLINSGKLSIIKNEHLRNYLSSWHTHIELIADRTEVNNTHSLSIIDFVSKHGNWLKVDAKNKLAHIQLPPSGFKTSNILLLQYPEFESQIDLKIIFKDGLLSNFNSTMKACEKILELINQEIKSPKK